MSKEFESEDFEYAVIDLHNHSKYSEEFPKTTFNEREILSFFEQIGKKQNKKVCFAVTDHDTALGAYLVYKELQKNRQKYPHVEFVPGMELNMSLERVLTYYEQPFTDPSFVFKKCHMLIHAKKGKEEEFFKRTFLYSTLAHKKIMHNKIAVNVGKQILAARYKLCETYSTRIPLSIYKQCAFEKDLKKIREIFLNKTVDFLINNNKIQDINLAKEEVSKVVGKLYPSSPAFVDDFGYYGRFNVFEINKFLGDSATICYAHPKTLSFKAYSKIPVKLFKDVDVHTLPKEIQNRISKKLNDPKQVAEGYFTQQDILSKNGIIGDWTGIVKLQLLHNELKKHNIKIDGYELTSKTADTLKSRSVFVAIANYIVDNMHLYLNYGSDKHYDNIDKRAMFAGKNRYYQTQKRTVENPYLKFNRLNRQLTNDENSFTLGVELEK